eukprot:807290-Pyramimonas_sp.AAC.1
MAAVNEALAAGMDWDELKMLIRDSYFIVIINEAVAAGLDRMSSRCSSGPAYCNSNLKRLYEKQFATASIPFEKQFATASIPFEKQFAMAPTI